MNNPNDRPAFRFGAVAIAAQVGADHGEILGQARCDLVPGQVINRIAVHQQQGRTLATHDGDDLGSAGLGDGFGEILEHSVSQGFHQFFSCPIKACLCCYRQRQSS
ncbi:hypothetical protein [Pseudomonas sp. ANT_H12B]|uniref:hypothetical protein n=1 Tax=Pseudomonas sp. ANT_H12B TaxID=2597348 RepID=UPI0021161229|nr:hypothetical protein [Pseudomonas sp. ANT_H12B]